MSEWFKVVIEIVATAVGSIWAWWRYRDAARRERANWARDLYTRFYEKNDLKAVREVLDCDSPSAEVTVFIGGESPELTDYLNFFEFVAYLQVSDQLKKADVDDLFKYYLDCLKRHDAVRAHIKEPKKGFEKLRKIVFDE